MSRLRVAGLVLAGATLIGCVTLALLLPNRVEGIGVRGVPTRERASIDSRLPLRIAIVVGGVAVAAELVWLSRDGTSKSRGHD
jgi:hypothetical protein